MARRAAHTWRRVRTRRPDLWAGLFWAGQAGEAGQSRRLLIRAGRRRPPQVRSSRGLIAISSNCLPPHCCAPQCVRPQRARAPRASRTRTLYSNAMGSRWLAPEPVLTVSGPAGGSRSRIPTRPPWAPRAANSCSGGASAVYCSRRPPNTMMTGTGCMPRSRAARRARPQPGLHEYGGLT